MDVSGWPAWARKYKLQPGTNEPVETKRLIKVSPIKHQVLMEYSHSFGIIGIGCRVGDFQSNFRGYTFYHIDLLVHEVRHHHTTSSHPAEFLRCSD